MNVEEEELGVEGGEVEDADEGGGWVGDTVRGGLVERERGSKTAATTGR